MPKKNGGKRGKAGGRAYARLARHERSTIELMLDRGASRRAIAAELGRAPSTVSNEAAAHRFVVAPKAEGRGARARGARRRLRAAAGVAPVPQRLQAQERPRLRQGASPPRAGGASTRARPADKVNI